MASDARAHPDEWENPTLERFLEALAASLEAIYHAYANRDEQFPNAPTWQTFAEVLVMASGTNDRERIRPETSVTTNADHNGIRFRRTRTDQEGDSSPRERR